MVTTETTSSKKNGKWGYVVTRGSGISEPTIFRSWAEAHARVNGFPNSEQRGFYSEVEAKRYIAHLNGSSSSEVISPAKSKPPKEKPVEEAKFPANRTSTEKKGFYAVSNGRKIGVFNTWSEAEVHVTGFSGNIHKGFKTAAEAEQFVADGVAARVKREILETFQRASSDGNHYHLDGAEILSSVFSQMKV